MENSSIYRHFNKYGIYYWITSSIILTLGMITLWKMGHVSNSIRYFEYNNPIILFSFFSLFVLFASFKIQSKYINLLATGMFGVFLMHTPPEIISIRNTFSSHIFQNFSYAGIFTEAICLFIILSIIAVPIEQINKRILKVVYGFVKK
jgi:hypothetical protein